MTDPNKITKTLKWRQGEAILVTILAFLVSLISWEAALGMVLVEWIGYLDHRYGSDSYQ